VPFPVGIFGFPIGAQNFLLEFQNFLLLPGNFLLVGENFLLLSEKFPTGLPSLPVEIFKFLTGSFHFPMGRRTRRSCFAPIKRTGS
jgi:hypothetical protein